MADVQVTAASPVPGAALTSFDVVDIRSQLDLRQPRAASTAREQRAFSTLASEMAANPRNMLQRLVEVAVDLCDAHTAGVSLLDGEVFRWEAVAGVFAKARGGTMPRDQSPCGVCIDQGTTQLMHLADRCFPALHSDPRFVEALLIPFFLHGQAVGTVWIVSHTDDRNFDREDERIMSQLSMFASAGWQLLNEAQLLTTRNQRKDDFLATLGHELRGPLGAIVAATSVLRHQVGNHGHSRDTVEVIARQSQHRR